MKRICIDRACFRVVLKPISVMGEYVALHGLVPYNELPARLRGKIPSDEVWIRKNAQKKRKVWGHERCELGLMITKGLPYKKAHKRCPSR